jgi:hypothetical protein
MPRIASFTSRALVNIGIAQGIREIVYAVAWDSDSYDEGDVATATITAARVDDGVTVGYTITGLTNIDISGGSLTGTVTMNNGTGTASITLAQDGLTEGTNTAVITLAATDSAGNITNGVQDSATVVDTSFDPDRTPWLDDNDNIVTVRSIISSVAMQLNGAFAVTPSVPRTIEGRTSGATTTIINISANTGSILEVDDNGNSTSFIVGEQVNLVL